MLIERESSIYMQYIPMFFYGLFNRCICPLNPASSPARSSTSSGYLNRGPNTNIKMSF